MTSLLIDAAVTTLIHDRLRLLHDAITSKHGRGVYSGTADPVEALTPVVIDPVEVKVLELARRALRLFEGGARGPVAPGAPRTGDWRTGGTSKFALLGGAGLDLPSWSDIRHRRHAWISETLRGGSPDRDLSHVIAPATELAFLVADKIAAVRNVTPGELDAGRAFAIGLMGAIASGTIVSPMLLGIEDGERADWPPANADRVAEVEAAVLRNVFGGRTASDVLDYFPTHGEVKDSLLESYLAALGERGMPLGAGAPIGFTDFEQTLTRTDVPTARSLRHAYHLLRAANSSWSGWEWFAFFLFYTVPVAAAWPIGALIAEDKARWQMSRLFRPESPGVDDPTDEAWSQMFALNAAASTIGPAITTLWLLGDAPEMKGDFIHGGIAFGLDVVAAVLLGASVKADPPWSKGWRWGPLVVLGLSRAVLLYRAFRDGDGPSRRYFWFQTFPLFTSVLAAFFTWIADETTDDGSPGNHASRNRGILIVVWVAVIMAAAALIAGLWFSGKSLLSLIVGDDATQLPRLRGGGDRALPYARAAVLDESTLWSLDPGAIDVTKLRYPPGSGRVLLHLWWTGTGELQVKHRDNQLTFRIGTSADVQVLTLPPVGFTPRQLAAWLVARVTGRPPAAPGPVGGLQAVPSLDDTTVEAAHPLPYPVVFGDTGDRFVPIGRDRAHAYPLTHGSRARLATPHGQHGPAVTAAEGWPIAPGPGSAGADGTGVGLAAELGTLLALGAASRIDPSAPVPTPVARVFQRWNLDTRRVNEWRQLVEGGARSEIRTSPTAAPAPGSAAVTETIAAPPTQLAGAATSPAVLHGTEALCDQLGWVPLFRAWSRVAADPQQDAGADQPASYSPKLRTADGRWVQPTNRQLSEAVRYLLDLT